MSVLTGISGAVRANIAAAANQMVGDVGTGIKSIAGLPTEGNNANLRSLYLKTPASSILSYPINVDSDPQQGHYIMFMINERIPGRLATTKTDKNIKTAGKKVEQELNSATGGDFDSVKSQAIVGFDNKLANAAATSPKGKKGINKSLVLEKIPTNKNVKTIALYMPPSVSVSYNVKYADQEIGSLAMMGQDVIAAFMQGGGTADTISKITDAIMGSGKEGLQNLLLSSVDAVAPGAKALMQLQSGTVVTPQMEMMFEGVGRRNFSYTFNFLPKSAQEARIIEDIIYCFKYYMMPRYSDLTTRREMDIPGTFDIRYYYKNAQNSFINKVSTCFLTQMDVEYGADRFTAYEPIESNIWNGKSPPPQKSKITLNFSELEVLSQDHIATGH